MRDTREREWIFQFLLNLNPRFDQACGQMLGKDLFPNIDEAFAHIRGKRSRKELKGGNSRGPTTEKSALAVAKLGSNSRDSKNHRQREDMV